MKKELLPVHDSARSFYKKANLAYEGESVHLISYTTKVATITFDHMNERNGTVVEIFGTHSSTTLRHIKEFLKQHGFKAETKKQIETDYMEHHNES